MAYLPKLALLSFLLLICSACAEDSVEDVLAAVEGDAEENPLWKAVEDACVVVVCERTNRRTMATFSDLLYDSLPEATNSVEKLKIAYDLIQAFLEENVNNEELCNALRNAVIRQFEGTVERFLELAETILFTTTTMPTTTAAIETTTVAELETTTTEEIETTTTEDVGTTAEEAETTTATLPGKCPDTARLLDDGGNIDTSELYLALDGACNDNSCTKSGTNALRLLAYDVSDVIHEDFTTAYDKLLAVIPVLQEFLDLFDKSTVLHNAILGSQIADWGSVLELLQCQRYAECQLGIAESLREEDDEGWCPLLDAVNHCDGCSRTDNRITWTLSNQIVSSFQGQTIEEKGRIAAAKLVSFQIDNASNSTIERLSAKIYGAEIEGWETVKDFLECVVIVQA